MASTPDGINGEWHLEVLPASTRQALEYLSKCGWIKDSPWYLAGGTALALQMGHRSSVDLDFFTTEKDFSLAAMSEQFSKDIWIVDSMTEGTIYGKLYDAKVSFIAYPFFIPRNPKRKFGAVSILVPRDIAVMKIVAISQRGKKRDFVDLYWYCQHEESLEAVVGRLPDQYPTVAHDFHHILKSMMYFVDADIDPMPAVLFEISWEEVKRYFKREVPLLTKKLLGLSDTVG